MDRSGAVNACTVQLSMPARGATLNAAMLVPSSWFMSIWPRRPRITPNHYFGATKCFNPRLPTARQSAARAGPEVQFILPAPRSVCHLQRESVRGNAYHGQVVQEEAGSGTVEWVAGREGMSSVFPSST